MPFLGDCSVIQCNQDNILPNLRSVADGNAATILKGTASIEKNIFPDGGIFLLKSV